MDERDRRAEDEKKEDASEEKDLEVPAEEGEDVKGGGKYVQVDGRISAKARIDKLPG